MGSRGRIILVAYDEKRYRFNTAKIEGLDVDENRKYKLKEMFDVFSKNRNYLQLLDSTTPRAVVVIIMAALLLSIIFLPLAIKSAGRAGHKHTGQSVGTQDSKFTLFYDDDATRFVSPEDVKSSIDHEKVKSKMDEEKDEEEDSGPSVGDHGTPGDSDFRLGIQGSYATNRWSRRKSATYWSFFFIYIIVIVVATLILINHQIRQRRLYQALEKYELDTIGDYMPELKDLFSIRRMHERKVIFSCLNCFYCYSFAYEVKTTGGVMNGQTDNRINTENYTDDTGAELNVTSELDYREYTADNHEFTDVETGDIKK